MSDSEDSDGEGGLGNVSRVVIRPPGHSGKAKRGHLCFDAAFETGNLGRADLVGEFEYDLYLRPDTCNPRFRFWFNFTVDNVKVDQRVIFNIVNISKVDNLFANGLTPLVKSTSRSKWQRIPKDLVFYYRSAHHQNHYVLSFAFSFDKEDEVYQFALAVPYSYSRLQSYLLLLESKISGTFEKSTLCTSLQNRHVELLTIDHIPLDQIKTDKNLKRIILIIARSHPGESASSFVCQGIIEFLLSTHPIAVILRDNFVFKIIPMVNPDGVFLGNNKCNLIGQDLNRVWHVATEFSHPTIYGIKNMIKELDASDFYQIDFIFDLHASTTMNGSFIYGNTYEDVYRYERHLVFPKLLTSNADDFVTENMMFNADEKKCGSARRFCCERLTDSINSYTLQISMGGYFLRGNKALVPYTEEDYLRFGRNFGRTLYEYYRFTNVLPTPTIAELCSRKKRPKTHRHASRSRIKPDVRPRPRTTRDYAPISYTDLAIRYDSSTSNDVSPVRYAFGQGAGFPRKPHNSLLLDQFSLLTIQSSTFHNLNFTSEYHSKRIQQPSNLQRQNSYSPTKPAISINIPPKPYLSIIDVNQLTRGSLDKAVKRNESRNLSPIRDHSVISKRINRMVRNKSTKF